MNLLVIISSALAIGFYFPLCKQIRSGDTEQNFSTWVLWAALDGIAAGSLMMQGGNFWLPGIYVIGASVVAYYIFNSKNSPWTWFESFITALVIICLVVWYVSGSKTATIASTLAMVIAGIPQTIDSYQKPWKTPLIIFTGFLMANFFSALGGKEWSIEERFYSVSVTIYGFSLVSLTALRRLWVEKDLAIPVAE